MDPSTDDYERPLPLWVPLYLLLILLLLFGAY